MTARNIVDTKSLVTVAPRYTWDEAKRASNLRDHKIDFTAVENFDWASAFVDIDNREDYAELREVAIGFIGEGLHVFVFTRRSDEIRVISLRKAKSGDARKYVEATK